VKKGPRVKIDHCRIAIPADIRARPTTKIGHASVDIDAACHFESPKPPSSPPTTPATTARRLQRSARAPLRFTRLRMRITHLPSTNKATND